jgi:hypothetical protein
MAKIFINVGNPNAAGIKHISLLPPKRANRLENIFYV